MFNIMNMDLDIYNIYHYRSLIWNLVYTILVFNWRFNILTNQHTRTISNSQNEHPALFSGGLHEWCEYWQLFTIISGAMFFCTMFCFVCYLRSARSLSHSTDSISTVITSGGDSKDIGEMASLTGDMTPL